MTHNKQIDSLVSELQERAKELNCLYTIEENLNRSEITLKEAFDVVIKAIPPGWQFPNKCDVILKYGEDVYRTRDFEETDWSLSSYIVVQEKAVGSITVYYTEECPPADIGPFLKEEKKLLNTIAERLGHFILHHKLKNVFHDFENARQRVEGSQRGEWRAVLDMIRKTDPNLFMSLLRKLLHLLCWKGVEEAEVILKNSSIGHKSDGHPHEVDENKPQKLRKITNYDEWISAILKLADDYLSHDIILSRIQKWMQEDKTAALVKVVESQDTSLTDIGDAIRKYYHLAPEKYELSPSTIKGLRVSLLRRFFTDHLDYISIAKEYVKLTDFYNLIDKMIFPQASHGKLGGKSAGLFLAKNILEKEAANNDLLSNIKTPKTWYMTSDGILYFMQYNNLEEVLEQKYKEIDEVRLEYPHIVQLFKSSQFPPDIVKGLSMALDDLGDKPLIVRSSSLLEDQIGAAFSGKYKSLFLANQGTKQERLEALTDAIAEVYASTFSPDPIEYRAERGLLDFHEEMGVMIQEVVGKRVGDYFLPAFAGVAFSNNEFRWSPRIKREDGLLRIVPGLGTRAVDRLTDDYPILVSPGKPNLSVNVTVDEAVRYSPKKIDVINLKTNDFETKDIIEFIREVGEEYPAVQNLVSILDGSMMRQPMGLDLDLENQDFVISLKGLLTNTNFLKRAGFILNTLQNRLKTPVDIEFAHTGTEFYILQCRPQSYARVNIGDNIPKDVPEERVVFSANRFVSNGKMPDITHVVYVDPLAYSEIEDKNKMLQIGRAVGRLNKMLPKRKFILMGPGRWGSRGDIKLGVSVTYSDLNNTTMLIEIARKKGNYLPDLSFGTHFFQDLVEAQIRYLPLYPDDDGVMFNENFLMKAKNIFRELIPEFQHLEDVIHVIDVPNSADGLILKVLMNADLDQALGMLTTPNPDEDTDLFVTEHQKEYEERDYSDHWRWRLKMVEKIASEMEGEKYGVEGFYVFGSTKNASAGPGSDIDVLLHVNGDDEQRKELSVWLDGWSKCLSEMNYLRCGYKTDGLLDVHYVTDDDIAKKTSYAVKIGAITDAARKLKMKNEK